MESLTHEQEEKQIHDLLDITLDVNGLEERRREKTGTKPTAFFQFSGHVAKVRIDVYKKGRYPDAQYNVMAEYNTDMPLLPSEIDSFREKALSVPALKEVDPQAVTYLETMIERYNEAKQTANNKFKMPDICERFELIASTIKNLIDDTYGEDAYITRLDGQMIRVRKEGKHVTD